MELIYFQSSNINGKSVTQNVFINSQRIIKRVVSGANEDVEMALAGYDRSNIISTISGERLGVFSFNLKNDFILLTIDEINDRKIASPQLSRIIASSIVSIEPELGNVTNGRSIVKTARDFNGGIIRTTYTVTESISDIEDGLANGTITVAIPGGGGGVSAVYSTTYSLLYDAQQAGELEPGAKYIITDYQTIYDQKRKLTTGGAISYEPKQSTEEALVLTAISDSAFDNYVSSLDFPEDVIKYDILYTETADLAQQAKGRITYREDRTGNKAGYDFRTVLFYDTSTTSELLTFDGGGGMNDLQFVREIGMGIPYGELPDVIFKGTTFFNVANLIYGGFDDGIDANMATVFEAEFLQNSNCWIVGSRFEGNVVQNTTMQIFDCKFSGGVEFCQASSVANSSFGGNVSKLTNSNFNNSSVVDEATRLINCAVLISNLGGKLYWCNGAAIFSSNIDGDIRSLNNFFWDNTDCNCNVTAVCGFGDAGSSTGFQGCTVIGTSPASALQNCIVKCLVQNKTIDEASYPELFQLTSTEIFRGSDNKIYYSYFNGSTFGITEIV